jgi:regulator of sigma D
MDYTINQFKKYLVDEIKSKSFSSYPEIYKKVDCFSKTREFNHVYEKWLQVRKNKFNRSNVFHIMD